MSDFSDEQSRSDDGEEAPGVWTIRDGRLVYTNFFLTLHAIDRNADPTTFVDFVRRITIESYADANTDTNTDETQRSLPATTVVVGSAEGVGMWFDGFEMLAVCIDVDGVCVLTGHPAHDDLTFGPRNHIVLPRDIEVTTRVDTHGVPSMIVPSSGGSRLRLRLFRQKEWARENYIRLCTEHILAGLDDPTHHEESRFPADDVRDIWEDRPVTEIVIALLTTDDPGQGIQVRSSGSELPPSTTTN